MSDEQFRRLVPLFALSYLCMLVAGVVVVATADHPWDTTAFVWGISIGLATALYQFIAPPLVVILSGVDGAGLRKLSALRKTTTLVGALVLGVALGLIAGA